MSKCLIVIDLERVATYCYATLVEKQRANELHTREPRAARQRADETFVNKSVVFQDLRAAEVYLWHVRFPRKIVAGEK